MMADLKDTWRQTAKSFVLALNDLGVSLYQTAKAGVDMAVEWARKDNPHVQTEGSEIPVDESADTSTEEPEATEE